MHDYQRTVDRMSRSTRDALARYFHMSWTPRKLWTCLQAYGLCQADIVLALLRMDLIRDAERLAGFPITRCPPCLRSTSLPVTRSEIAPAPVIRAVVPNPRATNTEAHARFCEFRVGRTIEQCHARGVRRRDVRLALRMNWITL